MTPSTKQTNVLDDAIKGNKPRLPKLAAFSRPLLAVASGLLLTLAFPHVDIGWLAFIALIPFLRTFPYARTRTAFANGFLLGFTYFGCLLYWIAVFSATKIGAFGVGAWFILSARESLWIGVFAAGVNFAWRKTGPLGRTLTIASLWTICEWARQLGPLGFGWGDIAYSQWKFLPLIQIASVTGIWGISWLLVLVNACLASAKIRPVAFAGLVVVTAIAFGSLRMANDQPTGPLSSASALQANFSEDVPYTGMRPSSNAYFYGVLNTFNSMARLASAKSGSTICVTAETSIPGYPQLDPPLKAILLAIAARNHVTLIAGARDYDFHSDEDTNSVFVYHPDGTVSGPYNKQQLVPFGEYVPFRANFPFLNAFHVLDFEMQPGSPGQDPLNAGGDYKAGVAVCYESTYPRFLREQVARGATFDVVVTDDTWYGRTAAAKQHFAMSVLRAVETNRYLVRCASTGISGVIAPSGKVLASAGLFKSAVVTAPIEQRFDKTLFVRYGDWFPLVCFAGFFGPFLFYKAGKNSVD